mmetsp:Transcript_12511/g.35687  ORF Transcript_12511/g.35687 Transcript_12511/m.35687 type:complete len:361 (-) Transcript_12511:20-1102(-)
MKKSRSRSVHLDVHLVVVLESLVELVPVQSLLGGDALEHLKNSRHHSLESAEVHVGTILHQIEDLIGILLNLVLDVHLSAALVGLLPGQRVVNPELVRVGLHARLDLIVVQLGVGVGDSHEQPGESSELVVRDILHEHPAPERAERSDSSSGGNHDDHGVLVLGEEQHLSGRSGHGDLSSRCSIAKEVGADSLLGGVLGSELGAPVGGAADAQGGSLAVKAVSVPRGGDGIQTGSVRDLLALGVDLGSRRDNSVRLSLNERDVSVGLDDDVHGLSGGVRSDNALHGLDLADEGVLRSIGVHRQADLLELEGHVGALDRGGGRADGRADRGPGGGLGREGSLQRRGTLGNDGVHLRNSYEL